MLFRIVPTNYYTINFVGIQVILDKKSNNTALRLKIYPNNILPNNYGQIKLIIHNYFISRICCNI